MEAEELRAFSGDVPIFPLPNVVLFPKTLLPLHIFEPRYREMTRDALAGDRLIAMALLKSGWKKDYYGKPPICDVVGLGRILQEQELEGGKFNLLLYGLQRAQVVEEFGHQSYRRARVELLGEFVEPGAEEKAEQTRVRMISTYQSFVKDVLHNTDLRIDPETPLGTVADVVAAMLDVPIEEKQKMLEELDVTIRAERVYGLLQKFVRTVPRTPQLNWPPKNSLN